MNVLNIEEVSKTFAEKVLFNKATLGVNKGDKIGLIGVNGTGKSTLLKIAAGIEEPDEGRVVKGRNVTVSYLAQAPEFVKGDTVLSYIMRGKDLSKGPALEAQAKSMLNKLGCPDVDAVCETLSGGQKKRIALVRTLLEPADVLILDEPTNHLDNEMVEWLEDYLTNFKGQLMMVTHDRYFLDAVTNKIAEIDRGEIFTYDTNYSGFLERKTQREEIERATEDKRQNMLRTELKWIQRGALARSTKQQARIDRYDQMKEDSLAARIHMQKDELQMGSIASRMGRKTIELENISKSFGNAPLIRDFTYIFLRDDRIGIVGPNGCGKSTLMKIITGQLEPDAGTVTIGETIKIGYFMQENEPLNMNLTVLETVKEIGEYVRTTDGLISASAMCEKFLFTPKMQWTPVAKLSGGERRRLYLLSVLMSQPNVLILDEPTNDLDIETLEILEDYLDRFSGIVITVSHDRYFLDRICTRLFVFEGDGVLKQYEGGYTDYSLKKQMDVLSAGGATGKGAGAAKISADSTVQASRTSGDDALTRGHARKLTYKEEKEWETIEEDISSIEERIEEIDQSMGRNTTDFVKLNQLSAEKEEMEAKLEEKMLRWEELSELVESINESK